MADNNPRLSIVITSYTTERLNDIFELLDSIGAQTCEDIETVFVAEKSRELYDQITAYAREKPRCKCTCIFNDGEPGASAARNLGIRNSRGEIIAFIDDDALPFADWAEKMLETYANPDVIGVTGPAFPLWEDAGDAWLPEELHWLVSCTSWAVNDEPRKARNVWLQNGSFRKEAFEQAGMLNASLGPQDSLQGFKGRELQNGVISEEIEISMRVTAATRRHIMYNPAVRVQHRVYKKRLRPEHVRRWSYWTGYSKHKTKKLYSQNENGVLQQESRLFKQIALRLIPHTIGMFFYRPVTAWRRLKVTVMALFFVALGYANHILHWTFRARKQVL